MKFNTDSLKLSTLTKNNKKEIDKELNKIIDIPLTVKEEKFILQEYGNYTFAQHIIMGINLTANIFYPFIIGYYSVMLSGIFMAFIIHYGFTYTKNKMSHLNWKMVMLARFYKSKLPEISNKVTRKHAYAYIIIFIGFEYWLWFLP